MDDDLEAIRQLLPMARQKTKGSADPLYDVIIDGEALLNGRPTWGNTTASQVRQWLEEATRR